MKLKYEIIANNYRLILKNKKVAFVTWFQLCWIQFRLHPHHQRRQLPR